MPELKKPSGVIHVDHVLSSPAQRLYNCLLAYCQDEIPDIHDVPVFQVPTELVRSYLNTRNDSKIKEWLRELRRKDVEFNNLGKGGVSWGCYGFIESPELVGSYIRFSIAPTLRQLMVDSTMFAKINLLLERRFKKSRHALPLYELGLDYRDNKDPKDRKGKSTTPWMTIDAFKKYMGIGNEEYKQFYVLNRDVIQRALKEVKAESDIIMELDKETEGRKVLRIRFLISDNKANMSIQERLERLQQTLPMMDGEQGLEQANIAQQMSALFDVTAGRARKIARHYVGKQDEFREICARIDQARLAGNVKGSLGAYAANTFDREGKQLTLGKDSAKAIEGA